MLHSTSNEKMQRKKMKFLCSIYTQYLHYSIVPKKNMCFLNIEFKFLKKIYEIKQIDVNNADKIQETDLV